MMSTKFVNLVGYILPPKTNNMDEESENDEGEEETVPEFMDMEEMDCVSSGGFMFQQSVPASDEVDFMFHEKKVRVRGRFPLKNPWWEISCSAQQYARRFVTNSYPSYKLRTDLKNYWCTIVPLFLKECDVVPDFTTRFMEWLPKDKHVDLINVEEALHEFGECIKEKKAEADYVKIMVSKSDAGFLVKAATSYPFIMKYLPTLLPGQFLNLLKKGKEEEEKGQQPKTDEENIEASPQNYNKSPLLARLEEFLKTDEVWKFGFGYIMSKEFRLVRCETKLKDFMSCDLFRKLSPAQQNALKVYNELKAYCRQFGHTYIERNVLEKRMKMQEVNIWEAVAFLHEHGVLNVEKQKIALRNLFEYENKIAKCLCQLIEGEPWKIDLDVREVLCSAEHERMRDQLATNSCSSASGSNGKDDESGLDRESASNVHAPLDQEPEAISIKLDPDQVRAAEMMCANAVTVISGKGGCGKTTVVSMIFKAAMAQQEKNGEVHDNIWEEGEQKENGKKPMEVLLTAPTGRAASLLTKKTCFTAYTMHQVLWSYMSAKKKEKSKKMLNWAFSSVRVLVVDEGSLVCVQILSSILSLLTKHAQLQKFIILGDVRQLPSIEPGNVLNDLFTSMKKVKWAIEMRTNHRAESKLIVENAGLIADMGVSKKFHHLNYDATVELGKTFSLPSPKKSFIEILLPEQENDDDLQNSIKRLLEGPAPGLQDDASSQFVAFRRTECALINELCCKHYSGHNTKTYQNKMDFQIGDKVCCTRNGYVTDIDKEDEAKGKEDDMDGNKSRKERLCNGEIFFIKQDVTIKEDTARKSNMRRYLTLDNKQGKKLTVDYRELMRECKLRHAWARTIHTFQGSEEKTIVYVLDNGIRQTWKHVYTAVTRGQSRVYVIAKQDGFKKAIQGYVIKRNTQLEGLVMDMLRYTGIAKSDFLSQPSQSQFNTPKRGSGFQTFLSTNGALSSPGPSQAHPGMKNPSNSGSGFGNLISPKSTSPSPCKRERISENCTTPSKQMKVDSPLGCSQLQLLSLTSHRPRQLFPKAPQSHQDQ